MGAISVSQAGQAVSWMVQSEEFLESSNTTMVVNIVFLFQSEGGE